MKFVLAITGPTGAGKSTVAGMLAKRLDKCVNIDVDHIKHMIVSGFYKDENNAGGWSFSQWGLVGDSIGLLAKNFLNEGYSVIINGYIDEPAWTNIQKHIKLNKRVLLLPDVSTVEQRDSGRSDETKMGNDSVKEHHAHFSSNQFFDDFTKIDTTNHTPEDTISEIIKFIS